MEPEFDYHDPFIPEIPRTREHPKLAGRRSIELTAKQIANYDAVLISTDHDQLNWPLLVETARLIIDTRNICQRKNLSGAHIVKA